MPGLRVGWTVAPVGILEKLVTLKQANDLHTSTVNQILAHELMSSILDEQLPILRRVYGERCHAMVSALQAHLPQTVKFTPPTGGMFVWLDLPNGLNARDLLKKALAEEKIAFVPGAAFHANGGGEHTLRLSFATCKPEIIEDAMTRLSALIARELEAVAA